MSLALFYQSTPFGLDFGTLDFGLGLDNFFKRPQDPDKDARWISLCGCFLWYRDDWTGLEIFGSYDNKSKLSWHWSQSSHGPHAPTRGQATSGAAHVTWEDASILIKVFSIYELLNFSLQLTNKPLQDVAPTGCLLCACLPACLLARLLACLL